MTDFAVWRCPACGDEIVGEQVVDPTHAHRIADHRLTHDDAPLYRFTKDDPMGLWKKDDGVVDCGWESGLLPGDEDFVPVRVLWHVARGEAITLDDPFERHLLVKVGDPNFEGR